MKLVELYLKPTMPVCFVLNSAKSNANEWTQMQGDRIVWEWNNKLRELLMLADVL